MSELPSNSTAFERALDEALDELEIIGPAITSIKGVKYARPLNPSVAPWLIQEYGLGPISQFFDTAEEVIDNGRPWQRIRGTSGAITMALDWIGYDDITISDQVLRRRRWHLYQIDMGELPFPDEDVRLRDAEYLADLSDPARSFFWRGYFGYDVRGHVWGRSRFGKSIWGDSSGVRINGGNTKWSHGRQHAVPLELTTTLKNALGVNYQDGDELGWDDNRSWESDGTNWLGVQRAALLQAWLILNLDALLALYDSSHALIGVIRILCPGTIENDAGDISLSFDAKTGFGDGAGSAVASITLFFGGQSIGGVKPFKRWLLPAQVDLTSSLEGGSVADVFLLGKTIREIFSITMHIGDASPDIAVPPDPPDGYLLTIDELELLLKDENADFLTTSED